MARPCQELVFTRHDIAKLNRAGTIRSVHQHVVRGRVDPHDLKSIVLYLAEYGNRALRRDIVRAISNYRLAQPTDDDE